MSELGPTLAAPDLAARKTLALFGRAEAQDFTDVYALARHFGKEQLLRWAAARGSGFDLRVFADMVGIIRRLTDEDLLLADPDATASAPSSRPAGVSMDAKSQCPLAREEILAGESATPPSDSYQLGSDGK